MNDEKNFEKLFEMKADEIDHKRILEMDYQICSKLFSPAEEGVNVIDEIKVMLEDFSLIEVANLLTSLMASQFDEDLRMKMLRSRSIYSMERISNELMKRLPDVIQDALKEIPNFENLGDALRHFKELIDGLNDEDQEGGEK